MTTRFGSDTVTARLKRTSEPTQSQTVAEPRGWRGLSYVALMGLVSLAVGGIVFPTWRARVDNQPAQVLRVDAGLLGVALDSGEHAVRLRYTPPFLALGTAIILVSMTILAGPAWRWPRLAILSA